MATIKDVAKLAGVSVSTVSKYLNGGNVRPEIQPAIRDAIAALDYRVNPFARGLKTQRNRSVGILLPDISAPFFGTVIMSLDKVLRENGYHSIIACYGNNHGLELDNLRFLLTNGIDGLIYIPEDISAEEFHEVTANSNIPVVQLDRMIPGVKSDAVLTHNTEAAYLAVSRLIEKGHKRIALICGPKSVFTAKERQIGYLKALSDHGLVYDASLMLSGPNDFATGYRGCEALISMTDRPTAIFATNHNITIGLVTAARDQGLQIPQDLDVFGFDSVEVCAMMRPPLPVVEQPEQEIGRLAATYLIDRFSGYTGEARITRLPCTVSEIESR